MSEGAGKGDKPRPKSISEKEYGRKYELIFGKKKPWWSSKEHQKLRIERAKFEKMLKKMGL